MNLKLNEDITFVEFKEKGEDKYYINNKDNYANFVVGTLQKEILTMFDGKRTFTDVYNIFKKKENSITDEQLSAFVAKAVEYRILTNEFTPKEDTPPWYKRIHFFKVFSFSAGEKLSIIIDRNPRSVRIIAKVWSYALVPFALFGMILFFRNNPGALFASILRLEISRYLLFPIAFFIFVFSSLFHELGHWFLYRAFGGKYREMGVAVIHFLPSFYTNIDDSKFFEKKEHRILSIFGGAFADISCVFLLTLVHQLNLLGKYNGLIAVCVILYIVKIIFNLNPLLPRSDGYFIFCELFGIKNLTGKAMGVFTYYMSFGKSASQYKDTSLFYLVYALLYLGFLMVILWLIISSVLLFWGGY